MNLIFCKIKKAQNAPIYFFIFQPQKKAQNASIFFKLKKKLKKHGFDFCKLKNLIKHE